MVSITGITAGQAASYYEKDNYYTKSTGEWQGKGAEALGLIGEVKKDVFVKLLEGKDPEGKDLIRVGATGEHRAGIDLTFSAPKSVSIMSELIGDFKVLEAHKKAVASTLKFVEANFSQARETHNGITKKVDTGNLIVARFDHNFSRELDPQIHTHTVFINATRRADLQWRALSNEELYQNKMFIGQYYRNELAANLKGLGYNIISDEKGLFEVRGIDQTLIDHFSQRSEQIDHKVKELRESGLYSNANDQKVKEIATLGSRVAKRDVNIELLKQSWVERLQEQGYTREKIVESTQKAIEPERTDPKLNEYDYIRLGAQTITEQESAFPKEQVLKIAGKFSIGEFRITDLDGAFSDLQKDREIIKLADNVYTTMEINKIEKDIVSKVQEGHDRTHPIMSRERSQTALEDYSLSTEQKQAATHILTSHDRIIGIQGDAGTGKTTMLAAVREIADKEGYKFKGLSFTGKAASELEKASGIKSQTIDSFLIKDSELPQGNKLWVVDESSMLGSKKMHNLIHAAEKSDARVVLVGDVKQLQSVDAGRMFQKLQEGNTLRTVAMSEIVRQQDKDYKDIVRSVADKKIDSAFQKLEATGRINQTADRKERIEIIVSDYTNRGYKKNLIIVTTNRDRNELNAQVRSQLKEKGDLKGQEFTYTVRELKNLSPMEKHFSQSYKEGDIVYAQKAGVIGRAGEEANVIAVNRENHSIIVERKDEKQFEIDLKKDGDKISVYAEKEQSFCKGDRVVFLKNDRALEVQNGIIGEIRKLDDKGNMTVKLENGRSVGFNISQYSYVDHGYAVTDYKSQGQTVKEVYVYTDTTQKSNYNSFYVEVSRGKEDVHIYTDDKDVLKEQVKEEQIKSSTLDYEKTAKEGEKEADNSSKEQSKGEYSSQIEL